MLSDWLERRTGNPNTTPSEKSPPGSRASVAYKRTAQNVPTAPSRHIRVYQVWEKQTDEHGTCAIPVPREFLGYGNGFSCGPLHGYKWALHTLHQIVNGTITVKKVWT